MIAYTFYPSDARVRLEAETLAAQNGNQVTVLTPKINETPNNYVLNGVIVKELNSLKYTDYSFHKYLLSYIKFTFCAFLACTKLYLHKILDVVHIHNMPNFLIFAAIVPRIFGKKIVLDLHDSVPEIYAAKFHSSSSKIFKILCLEEYVCTCLAQKLLCVNNIQRNLLVERGIPSEKITVIMNMPDTNMFSPREEKQYKPEKNEKFRLVYHGTITRRLGIDLAIRAVSSLVHSIPNIEFHIWGHGDYLNACKKLSQTLGVQDYIFFHDTVPVHKLQEILCEMDLGVVPNRQSIATEIMLPVKLLEYVAMEIPVVVPKLKTIQYYFSNDMVSYFDPGDVKSLSRAVYTLYSNKILRIKQSRNALGFLQKYRWHRHRNDFLNLYNML